MLLTPIVIILTIELSFVPNVEVKRDLNVPNVPVPVNFYVLIVMALKICYALAVTAQANNYVRLVRAMGVIIARIVMGQEE